ncbi:hypothetical protein HNP33_000585 [Comamonas odontotermitis]|uniref:Uncharacterized protein n=1 Tax=Comamonas odontotermitis TaxID=379895 RepID=A0ABR6RBN9_9BURK|nr:hypothetical protein [Comamonas odontotermitis]
MNAPVMKAKTCAAMGRAGFDGDGVEMLLFK